MIKKILGKIEIVLAVLALVLIIVIFINPPTDFDGGPMMAYNFLFFFPMLLIAGLSAFISLIIAIKKVIKKQDSRKTYPVISIVVSSPVFLYFVIIATKIIFPTYDPELEAMLAEMDKPSEIFNNTINIDLDSGKTIYLNGCNWGKNYENRLLFISTSSFKDTEFNASESYACRGRIDCEVYYKQTTDSLFLYFSDTLHFYKYIYAKRLDEIPLRTVKLDEVEMDSVRKEYKINRIDRFEWK